ncbi:MAG TPA: hypothetical protein VM737_07780 [Gemmatimonadota bacterium]|nr:hypothetical protein [Gemmatimonadota bacterium]
MDQVLAPVGPREIIEDQLADLLEVLAAVPALAARPVLAGILTAAIDLGVASFLEYRDRVRAHPIVPYAAGHRPTRRELGAYIRRRGELANLREDLERAEAATGSDARRRWAELRRRVGRTQADLAAPLAGSRGAVMAVDGFLARLLRSGTVDLPVKERRALLDYLRDRLGDG